MEILSLKQNEEQNDRWHKYLEKSCCEDVYFFPEYARTFTSIEKGTSHLFIYEKDGNRFIYPFRLRKIPQIEQFSEWFDITSDYGYGGPVISVANKTEVPNFIKDAVSSFDEYCIKQQIVSEFCRFHPLLKNAQYMSIYKPIFCNQTVWVDLTMPEEECWKQIRKAYRRHIRQSEKKHGIEIEISDNIDNIDVFYKLYTKTMQEVGASGYYFFSNDFFRYLFKYLTGHVVMFLAHYQRKIIAASIFIYGKEFLHYHFGAMDREFSNINANKAIFYKAIKWGIERRLKKFHLGGGVGGANSLMHFKEGFSKFRADFHIAKRIHNHDIYQKLCIKTGVEAGKEPFFPAYRAIYR
ncbi:GNAT family N-acetyltransferase [Desulfococcaceae bacterium HSG9]|nr:GNAT family N-acetyltransferase [Desulfococcaceae bacterium HSG9]